MDCVYTCGVNKREKSMLISNSAQLSFANLRTVASLIFVAVLMSACGGGSSSAPTPTPTPPPPPASTYTIGGTVTGLTGTGLTLADNGGDILTVPAKATSFTFATALASGAAYAVTVATQPTGQTCTVSTGSGTVGTSNVTTVAVACTTGTFTVGGTITGLTGTGLVLQDNGGDNLTVPANATTFTFATPVATGAPYAVTVLTQPTSPALTCTVTNGSGTMGSANITTVAIACTSGSATVTVGGTITGLTGSGLVLQDNAGDNLTVAAKATTFTFLTALAPGAAYAVTILTQPAGQTCTVGSGTGTATANVTNVTVFCKGVGRFVFVVNEGDDAIAAFTINATTGALTAAGTPAALELAPAAIAVDQTGQFVYVPDRKNQIVSQYSVNSTTGALTAVPPDVATANTGGTSIAVTPSNQYVYVGGFGTSPFGSVAGFGLAAMTGILTPLAFQNVPAGNWASALAIDPTGQFLFATAQGEQHLYVFNIDSDGTLTPTAQTSSGPEGTGSAPSAVAVFPLGGASGGYVYTADSGANRIGTFSYDGTGTLNTIGDGDLNASATQPQALAIDPSGKFLYVANYADDTVSTFSLDPTTGLLTFVTQVSTGNMNKVPNAAPTDMKLDPSGQFLFVANKLDGSVSVFTVAAGVLTLAGTYASGTNGDATPIALAVE
jgi:6-phosphogluconolactonase (cycloisomerase 2 family)